MNQTYIKARCRSSMLRRKVEGADDTESVDLSICINAQASEFLGPWLVSAELTMHDSKGQQQWVRLPHQVLMAIVAGVQHIEKDYQLVPLDPSIVKHS